MKTIIPLTTLALMLLQFSVTAQDLPTVKSVEGTVELAAISNEKAAAYWASIADYLETAIVTQVTQQIADDGVDLTVDIAEVPLSNGVDETFRLADTRLVGTVIQKSETDECRPRSYELALDVNQSLSMIAADLDLTTLPADTRVHYDAMIAACADEVVKRPE